MFLNNLFSEARKIAEAIENDCQAIISAAQSTQAETIAKAFPEANVIDTSCIAIATAAKNAAAAVEAAIPGAQAAVDGIYAKMRADITQIRHNNPKRGVGFYLSVVGAVMEDFAAAL